MIARKSFLIVSSHFLSRFLGWIGLVILAKLWGDYAPEALGYIGFAMAFLTIFHIIANFGFLEAHVKRISEGKDLGTCIGTYAAIKIVFTAIMTLIVLLAVFLLKNVFNDKPLDPTTESIIYIFLVYYIFLNLKEIPMQTFSGTRETVKRQLTWITENFIKIPLTIIVAIAGVSVVGITPFIVWPSSLQPVQQYLAARPISSLAMTYVIGIIMTFIVGMWFLRKYPIKKPSWDYAKSYFSFALPMTIIALIVIISINIDKLMIGYFITSSAEVGYYHAVQQISEVIVILSLSLDVVLFPALSEYHSSSDYQKLIRKTYLAERYISMTTIPLIVMIIVFVNPLIYMMLSGSFIPAASVLITFSIYAYILGLMKPYSSLVGGMNKPVTAAKIGILVCSVNIILNTIFIPRWGTLTAYGLEGATGAAIATAIAMFIGLISFRIAAKRLTGTKLIQKHIPLQLFAGVIMAGSVYAIHQLFIPYVRWYHLPVLGATGLGIYVLILYLIKEFQKEDYDFFINMIHPKEMVKYIKAEMNGDIEENNDQ